MREILFRGKRLCLDEWVEGYFLMAKMYRCDEELCEYISVPHPKVEGMPSDNFLVDPDTIGQFTGLTDKNGKKIFEGDIVDILTENEEIGVVVYDDGGFQVDADGFCVDFHSNIYGTDLEIIGNIHDNPELLGGASNE